MRVASHGRHSRAARKSVGFLTEVRWFHSERHSHHVPRILHDCHGPGVGDVPRRGQSRSRTMATKAIAPARWSVYPATSWSRPIEIARKQTVTLAVDAKVTCDGMVCMAADLKQGSGSQEKRKSHGIGHDRTGPDGNQHGAAPSCGPVTSASFTTSIRKPCRHSSKRGRSATTSLEDFVEQAENAARRLDDGAGGGGRSDAEGPRPAPRTRRRGHRRRQLLLPRRHPPRRRTETEGHSLCRRRDQRRRLGLGAGLLPDDRRRGSRRPAPRPDLRRPGPEHRCGAAHARPREGRRHRRTRLPALRARAARATSSRWSTTASSTASWPPMRKG